MDRLIGDLGDRAHPGRAVSSVERAAQWVDLYFADGSRERYDQVVLACHSDQALRLVSRPTPSERSVLSAIRYQPNRVILHRDPALMPQQRRVWSSWNYLSEPQIDPSGAVSVTYWMNSLQRLATRNDYFVSLNPLREPAPDSVVAELDFLVIGDADLAKFQGGWRSSKLKKAEKLRRRA